MFTFKLGAVFLLPAPQAGTEGCSEELENMF